MEFTMDLARKFIILADRVNGSAEINSEGQLIITGVEDAPSVAATITNDEFPFGYITAEDDRTLIFRA